MSGERARIVFAGTPAFAVPTLTALVDAGYEVTGVLTQPDRPAGRGRRLRTSAVKDRAAELGLPLLQPPTLKRGEALEWLAARRPDIMVIVAYGLLLPVSVLQLPPSGCVNLHASLLPRWRGAAPIQAALLHGDSVTGVSIMRMEAGLDTGPVYATEELAIGPEDTTEQLHDRLAVLGARCLVSTLPGILDGDLVPKPQDEGLATYAPRIDKADAVIDWTMPALRIHDQIRAYNPWPVAETLVGGARLRCWASRLADSSRDTPKPAGTVLEAGENGVVVQTGGGLLVLTELQLAGRRRMSAREFAHGHAVSVLGKRLGA